MSDEDWKRRIGITINYSPDSSEDDITLQFRDEYKDEVLKEQLSPLAVDNERASSEGGNNFMDVDDIFDFYEDFGQTPPRTRLSRRQKERNQRVKELGEINNRPTKLIDGEKKCKMLDDCLYFNELLEKADSNAQESQDNADQQPRVESSRREKRSRKLLRGSERDMKLDLSCVSQSPSLPTPMLIEDDRSESMPLANQQQMKVETFNRFLSLSSKPVNSCREFKDKCKNKDKHDRCKKSVDFPQDRVDFHKTFSLLIRMGSGDNKTDKNTRRHLSREEDMWQNELKDLIWLELQAWQADRTPREQDDYLCKAREKVADLLDEIINYRFERRLLCNPAQSVLSTQQSDSGISGGGDSSEMPLRTIRTGEMALGAEKLCPGCVSMFCQNCLDTQNIALREVEQLLKRLEAAEQLYSSSKAFGQFYPLYASHKFTARVKTMCVWYNMMKHHRLRLKIIGKMLMFMENTNHKDYNWPPIDEDDPSSSGMGTDVSDDHYLDTHSVSRSTSIEGQTQPSLYSQSKNQAIQFADCQGNPSDSNNSNISSNNSSGLGIDTLMDIYDMSQITHLRESIFPKNTSSPAQRYPYRKYMEQVLKTRGLKTSVNFLERLHKKVLQKAQVTFEKPRDLDNIPREDNEATNTTMTFLDDMYVEDEDCEDLRRYGYWSKEYKALNLPSYLGAYLFLCSVPLELTHEYIIMRLEQKPDQPSVLSIRQLMREFQEGISLSIFFKQRYVRLVDTVLGDIDDQHFLDGHKISLINFDKSVKTLLEVYLEYLQQWIQMAPRAIVDKNFLEEEWTWLRSCSPLIPETEGLIAHKFCRITIGMIEGISNFLTTNIKKLIKNMSTGEGVDCEDCSQKQIMLSVCREFTCLFNCTRAKALKLVAFAKTLKKDLGGDNITQNAMTGCSMLIASSLEELKNEALSLRDDIAFSVRIVEKTCDVQDMEELDNSEKNALQLRCREVLHSGYKIGFEYHKEVSRLVTGKARCKLTRGMISFAQQWMIFVKERCERGRGLRPRWANHGLDFLNTVCEPENTQYLSDSDFEKLKSSIDECISHVIGTAVPASHSPPFHPHMSRSSVDQLYPRSRGSSPCNHARSKGFRASKSVQDNMPTPPSLPQRSLSTQTSENLTNGCLMDDRVDGIIAESLKVPVRGLTRTERVQAAIEQLENDLEDKLRSGNLIGALSNVEAEDKVLIRPRGVTFSWQRGIKIGQGRFGKVYTAVNNQTGDLMAMKEIQLQPNDHRTIRRVTEELRIFEGIQHYNLVRYYGVEIHREEMLIFMEFCAEGTLESLVVATENGLPEALIRRYTLQMLLGVSELHNHGIVHRDIKSANIFLTDEGNGLKLGDFGSAAKIKAHTTMVGELQGYVGTQAYMAPEVFMKTNTEGHGRAADVWSVGCVVIEMASGKRPWSEYDSNYQVMFKVGMGESPAVPESLSEEGEQFLELCLQHDPRNRGTANELLHHNFVKVDNDDESVLPSIFEEYFKLTPKR